MALINSVEEALYVIPKHWFNPLYHSAKKTVKQYEHLDYDNLHEFEKVAYDEAMKYLEWLSSPTKINEKK